MHVLPGPTKSNTVLAWSPCGRFLAAGGSGVGVSLWDVMAGTPRLAVLEHSHGGEAMRFCPRTGRLYVAFRTGGVWSYDPATGEEKRRPLSDGVNYSNLCISNDGRTIVLRRHTHSWTSPSEHAIVGYAVADDDSLSEAWVRITDDLLLSGNQLDLAFRHGTDQLFGVCWRASTPYGFEWVAARTGELLGSFSLPARRDQVKAWVLSPDGERVMWLTESGLYLRSLDGTVTKELPSMKGEIRRGLALHPSDRMLAYTTGKTVRLLDADTFEEIRALDWNTGNARAVAFSPDGFRCAASGDGGRGWVTVFDVE